MQLQRYLRAGLWIGGLLLVAALVAGVLWLVLAEAGDQAGSQGVKGVALVAVVCVVIDLVSLVVLLAVIEITRPQPNDSRSTRSQSDNPPP
jgi:hypothetical protein